MRAQPIKITRANAGGPRGWADRAHCAARIAQFCRSAYSLVLPAISLQESDMTKTFSVYAALLLLVLPLSACQTTIKRSDSIVERAIAAWNSHDPDKTVTAYTDDVVYEDVP